MFSTLHLDHNIRYNCEHGRRVKCSWIPPTRNCKTCRQCSQCHEIDVDHAEAYNRYTSIVNTHGNGITLCSRWALKSVFRARYTLLKDSYEQKPLPFCHPSCENSRFPTYSVLMTEKNSSRERRATVKDELQVIAWKRKSVSVKVSSKCCHWWYKTEKIFPSFYKVVQIWPGLICV